MRHCQVMYVQQMVSKTLPFFSLTPISLQSRPRAVAGGLDLKRDEPQAFPLVSAASRRFSVPGWQIGRKGACMGSRVTQQLLQKPVRASAFCISRALNDLVTILGHTLVTRDHRALNDLKG